MMTVRSCPPSVIVTGSTAARCSAMVAFANTSLQLRTEALHALHGEHPLLAGIAQADEGAAHLLTPYPAIAATFEVAKEISAQRGSFTALELAEKLEEDYRNTMGRLRVLHKTGAMTYWQSQAGKVGPYRYRTAIDKDLVAKRP